MVYKIIISPKLRCCGLKTGRNYSSPHIAHISSSVCILFFGVKFIRLVGYVLWDFQSHNRNERKLSPRQVTIQWNTVMPHLSHVHPSTAFSHLVLPNKRPVRHNKRCVFICGEGHTDVDFNEDIIPCVVAADIHDLEDLI